MRNAVMVVLVLTLGCAESPISGDAPSGPVRQCPDEDPNFNFYGEACTEDAYPSVTVCHGDDGWCVAGTCRPQCGGNDVGGNNSCSRCAAGVATFTERGACYCAPG